MPERLPGVNLDNCIVRTATERVLRIQAPTTRFIIQNTGRNNGENNLPQDRYIGENTMESMKEDMTFDEIVESVETPMKKRRVASDWLSSEKSNDKKKRYGCLTGGGALNLGSAIAAEKSANNHVSMQAATMTGEPSDDIRTQMH